MTIILKEVKDDSTCENCGKNPAEALHPCPFRADVNDDSETLCNCCPECEHECAMDI